MPPSPARVTPDYVHAAASFAAELSLVGLGRRATDHALTVVRDTLGCIIAGSTLPEIKGLRHEALRLGGGGGASAVGVEGRLAPQTAAMINAAAGVSLELDEGCQFSTNHPSVHILPAALAVAEAEGKSGRELLEAFVAGYEVACWIGHASRLRSAVHPFGTHAIIGAAVAAARLSGFTADEIAGVIELSAGLALASSQTAANTGASVRNAVTGLTAMNGVLAPILFRAGVAPEPDAVATVFGRVLGDNFDPTRPDARPGGNLYLLRNYFKIYACSRWNHAPIEATIAAMTTRQFDVSEISHIVVWTFDPAIRLSWQRPVNAFAAKHSIPFNVAVRLVRNTNSTEAYTQTNVEDAKICDLMSRIEVREDPAYTRVVPRQRPARVEIRLRDGAVISGACETPHGGYDRPFAEGVLEDKFRRLAGLGLPATSVGQLDRLITAMPDAVNLEPIGALLRAAHA